MASAAQTVAVIVAIGLSAGAVFGGQSSVSFKVTVTLAGTALLPGSVSSPQEEFAICRSNNPAGVVECVGLPAMPRPGRRPIIGTTPVIPTAPGGVAALPQAPIGPLPSVALTNPVRPPNVATPATQPDRQWQAVATGSYRTTPATLGNPVAVVAEQGLFRMLSSVSETRLVSWSGRDYIELTLSW